MKAKSANEAARLLGSIRTEKKAAASRENGKRGGRPRKSETPVVPATGEPITQAQIDEASQE